MNNVNRHYVDEIDLVDLFLGLKHHWRAMLITLCITAIAGLLLIAYLPQRFSYTTVLHIGGKMDADGVQLIERPESVMAELENTYLPAELQAMKTGTQKLPRINVSIPKGSDVVLLQAKGTRKQGPMIMALMKSSLERVMQHHSTLLKNQKNAIVVDYSNQLQKLDDRIGSLKAHLDNRKLAPSDKALMSDELQSLQQQKTELKQRMQEALTALQGTKIMGAPQESAEPTSLGFAVLAALDLILSTMAAIAVGLLGMFADAVKRRSEPAMQVPRNLPDPEINPEIDPVHPEPSLISVARHRQTGAH